MVIKEQLRRLKRQYNCKLAIKKSYSNDCAEYSKYQYNNPQVTSKNSLEAKILRQTHVIEKGMSLRSPKSRFGVEKANELLKYINEFVSYGYSISDSIPVKNAIGVLGAYIDFHKARGFKPQSIIDSYNKVMDYLPPPYECFGIIHTTKKELDGLSHGEFPEFFRSRHSVRQFSDTPLRIEDVKNSVELAMRAPSACNRQSCKAYFYQSKDINQKLGNLIAGNTGFDSEVQNYIVVTSDMSAFYDAFERNQVYVDGGIFSLALVESFHYFGIASCILQNGEQKEKNKKFREICGNIPENEKIILFIAIGYYKEDFSYAISYRKELSDILKIG